MQTDYETEGEKPMKEFEIRKGTPEDIEQIAELYDAVNDYLESHINYPGWRKGIYPVKEDAKDGVDKGTLYVLWADGKAAGSVVVNQFQEKGYETAAWKQEAKPEEVAVIHTFLVHPDFLGRGFGKNLLEFAEEKAREQKRAVIRLDVNEKNTPAIKLYRKLGYCFAGKADLGYGEYGIPWFELYEKSLTGKA
ncbi:GNAT family N-acetyltransferase [Lacrimispora sp. 38-1]|uniref:GNAT family N-acetyltransferase n=1 Tax=Lacrimispora sp. 38-1 TaxID=3125778 RepID=UPI003CF1D037